MANDVVINLRAVDGSSNTFRVVGREAQAMGTTIDKAATTGSTALGRLNKTGAALGGAFSALQGTMAEFARAGAEAEASHARLETAIDNTGHSILEYQDQLDAAGKTAIQLGFDDEKAADAIATLTTATGDASKAIQDVAIAEDIARARGISLADATRIVIAAEQGRMGALNRVGIQLDANATREERMDALQQRFAGNAEAYANTTAGAMDRVREQFGNVEESIGQALGPFQTLIALGPGLQVGYTAASAAIGAMIPEMEGATASAIALDVALGPVGLAALAIGAVAGVVLLGHHMRQDLDGGAKVAEDGIRDLNAQLESFIQTSSELSPLAAQTTQDFSFIQGALASYEDQLTTASNAVTKAKDAKDRFMQSNPGDAAGVQKVTQAVADAQKTFDDLTKSQDYATLSGEQLAKAEAAAKDILGDTGAASDIARTELARLDQDVETGKITWQAYIDAVIQLDSALPTMSLGMIKAGTATDAQTTATTKATAAVKDLFGAQADMLTQQTDVYQSLQDQIKAQDERKQKKAYYAAFAGMQVQAGDLNDLIARNAAVREQQGAYYGLADGIQSAGEAQAVFKQTQDDLIGSEGVYTGQLGTYNTQLGYVNDAVDLLNQRQAEGIPLTKEQTDFLNGAAAAQERLQGGADDATIALGMQAEQYAENMRIGDELNTTTGNLDSTIQDLILALQGIPGYVKTTIDLQDNGAEERALRIKGYLDSLNGYYANAVINVGLSGPGVGYTLPQYQHGGLIEHAQHGRLLSGWSWAGEAGPELIHAPGATVVPATASREATRGNGGGNEFHFHAPVTVVANDPRQFIDQMRTFTYGSQR